MQRHYISISICIKQRITPYISNLKHMQRQLSTIFRRSSGLIIESQRPLTKRFTK